MSHFVLVHGGWRGGWIWKRVAQLLRKEGHDVYTPTLAGLADRNHLLHADINLSTHIQDIVNLIKFEELNDVVLCRHSYAGMVISGVADQISERISSLVYLDAWFPRNGESIMTLSPEAYQLMYIKDAGQYGGIACSPIPAAVLHVNEEDRAWVDTMATPHPLSTMIEAIHLEGSHLKVKKKTFVLASAWEPNPFKQFYERLQGDPVWITGTIESGHDAMLDKPEELASLLREAASDYRQVGVTGNMSISHRAEFMAHPLGIYFDYLTPDDSGHQVNVVMVHGGSHTGGCYLMTAEGKPGWANRFAERGYRVGVPDWPGHGRSGAHNLRALTGEQVCQSLAALISGLNGPVVLLTHSMGSALGWRVAELCGDKIIAIVGIAPAPSGNIQPGPEILSDSEEGLGLQTPFRTLTLRHKGAVLVTPEFVVDKLADNRMQ